MRNVLTIVGAGLVCCSTSLAQNRSQTPTPLPPGSSIPVSPPPKAVPPGGLGSPATGGGVLYDNGATDGSNGYSNATVGVFGFRRTVLDDFTVPPGEGWGVNCLAWTHLWNTLPPGSGTSAELDFRSDSSGAPGAPFATASVTSYTEIATGNVWFSRPEAATTATFDTLFLGEGTYWFDATVVGPENNFWMVRSSVAGSECWVDYEDLGGLQPGTSIFGVPADLNFKVQGGQAQPPGEFSTISTYDSELGPWDDVWDAELAGWLKQYLEPGGTPNYQDLKFVFQECYGGGMLDDLKALKGKWIGSSASRHDEESWGIKGLYDGYSWAWSASPETNMKKRHEDAVEGDPFGPNVLDWEHPQLEGGGQDWEDIELGMADSKHAILFSGQPDERHWNDMMLVRAQLIADGGFPPDNIKIYSADGTKGPGADPTDPDPDGEGTKAALKQAIEDVAPVMNENEQLFIYVTDHGDNHSIVEALEQLVQPFSEWLENFSLADYLIDGMKLATDPGPDLSLRTRDVVLGSNEVFLNGTSVGFLTVTGAGTSGMDSFSIDPALLATTNNTVRVVSGQSQDLFVSEVTLGTGPVPTQILDSPGVKYCDPNDGHPNNAATIDISGDDLAQGPILVCLSSGPPNQFAYLLIGNGNNVVSQPPGAKGDLCVLGGSCLGRYASDIGPILGDGTFCTDIESSASGGPSYGIRTCGGNIQPGETWNFQYWHRQPMGQPSTFSQAISVTFQ